MSPGVLTASEAQAIGEVLGAICLAATMFKGGNRSALILTAFWIAGAMAGSFMKY